MLLCHTAAPEDMGQNACSCTLVQTPDATPACHLQLDKLHIFRQAAATTLISQGPAQRLHVFAVSLDTARRHSRQQSYNTRNKVQGLNPKPLVTCLLAHAPGNGHGLLACAPITNGLLCLTDLRVTHTLLVSDQHVYTSVDLGFRA